MPSLAERMDDLLRPGGRLSARWPRYENRLAQRTLAGDVARTFERGGVLIAEAPTGVGKSLAYLLPSVLGAIESDRRVVIATCTKSLQDQLFERDLPALLEALGVTVSCARLKGKQNYLCPRALDLADSSAAEERDVLDQLREWAADDASGDLDRFPAVDAEAFRRLRPRIATDPTACSGATCRRGRECFWVRARREAGEARVLIVNHALLALSGAAEGLLPEFDWLVVDEAHRLEGVLLQQLERSVSRSRIEDALRLVGTGRGGRGGGLLPRVQGYAMPLFDERVRGDAHDAIELLGERVTRTRHDADTFFAAIEPQGARHELYGVRERYRDARELLGRDFQLLAVLLEHAQAFASGLSRLAGRVADLGARGGGATRDDGTATRGDDLAAELEQAAAQWTVLGSDLEHLGESAARDWVYWRSSGRGGLELHGSPVSVGDHARRLVLGRASATVLTSATLATDGDFAFTAERLGLGESHGMPYESASYPSPFPLERQMRAFVWTGGGDEATDVSTIVEALARTSGRNVLVLFTAHERLRRARERLRARLPHDQLLLAQEWDGSAARVSERFRAGRGAILLGVQSLWEGVDFPGEALEVLVVAKLPFSVPDEPLVEARGERLRDAGREPFRDDAVPEAVLRFRQGIGRLIRRADDRGVLVVCDPRLAQASYRGPFLAALPVAPRRAHDAEALAREAAAFLSGEEVPA